MKSSLTWEISTRKGADGESVANGIRNDRGERLVQYCQEVLHNTEQYLLLITSWKVIH